MPGLAACQASLSISNSWSFLKLMSIESVMPSSHLILCRPLLLVPPIPPSIRVFSNESTLRMRWPKYLRNIITNKASGGDGIPVELFQILKDYAVKVLHSICQQIWKSQQWPQDWKRSFFIPIPKKGNQKNTQTSAQLYSHTLIK